MKKLSILVFCAFAFLGCAKAPSMVNVGDIIEEIIGDSDLLDDGDALLSDEDAPTADDDTLLSD
jgi:hypothetical protein